VFRGFVVICALCVCVGLFSPRVVVAHSLSPDSYHFHEDQPQSAYDGIESPYAESCVSQAIQASNYGGYYGCHAVSGLRLNGGRYEKDVDCKKLNSSGVEIDVGRGWIGCRRFGSMCPPESPYQGQPWYGCVGVQPADPATPDDPCVGSSQPPGTDKIVDVTNCSEYVNSGGVSVCTGGGTSCYDLYCPSGNQAENCTPTGWIPDSPDDTYSGVPEAMVPSDQCGGVGGCGGGTPTTADPPANAGEPNDPADPSQGSVGDVAVGETTTTSTSADGSTTTTTSGINFNPYSGARTETTTTTKTNADGSSETIKDTTTTKPNSSGSGTTTTRTTVKTTRAADGSVTGTEVSGSTSTNDGEVTDKPKASASGGDACSSEPKCSGDPIQCAIFKQIWRDNCVFNKVSGGGDCGIPVVCDDSQVACTIAKQMHADRCIPDVDVDLVQSAVNSVIPSTMLTEDKVKAALASDGDYEQSVELDVGDYDPGPSPTSTGAACPLPLTFQVLDQTIEIGNADFCGFLSYVAWFVRISASLVAIGIITGLHVARGGGGDGGGVLKA